MRDLKFILKQEYQTSRALVIGINKYENASPLQYAVNDAQEISETLVSELGFDKNNIICLTDEKATKANILKSYFRFSKDDVEIDDRLFVFFAGHGHTIQGVRGEVGFLVPYDANMEDYSTFIRWDELTKNAELIRAKHILFVMDACYGGLAVHRDLKSGSSRFLRDMYQRLSRQVITAGKANEAVADAGGPLPNHSIFTGHFIEGVRGKAKNEHGVITASGIMAYVYSKVSNDINSKQTPHYGQFDGDGDFIISAPKLISDSNCETKDVDELITIPYVDEFRSDKTTIEKIEYIKELISSSHSQIKLHDFIVGEVRRFLSDTSEDAFVASGHFSKQEFLDRIASYENHISDLLSITACLSHWADDNQLSSLSKVVNRASDRLLESEGGLVVWINLKWYPMILIAYNAGIAAIENKNYKSLAKIFYSEIGLLDYQNKGSMFVEKISSAFGGLVDTFKHMPDHERHYTPISEYLFKMLQPGLDDLFFLGKGYEDVFDEFELLFSLTVADLRLQKKEHFWGPIGRFGWKNSRNGLTPLLRMNKEASLYRDTWEPLQGGLFGGSYERFVIVATKYEREILQKLNWY